MPITWYLYAPRTESEGHYVFKLSVSLSILTSICPSVRLDVHLSVIPFVTHELKKLSIFVHGTLCTASTWRSHETYWVSGHKVKCQGHNITWRIFGFWTVTQKVIYIFSRNVVHIFCMTFSSTLLIFRSQGRRSWLQGHFEVNMCCHTWFPDDNSKSYQYFSRNFVHSFYVNFSRNLLIFKSQGQRCSRNFVHGFYMTFSSNLLLIFRSQGQWSRSQHRIACKFLASGP